MEISTNQRKLIFLSLVTILFLILLSALFLVPQKAKKRFEEKVKREYQQTSENIEKLEKEKEEREKKFQEIINQCKATEDLKIEGIEIEISGDKKIVKNKKYGYQIEVPKEMLLVKTISPEKIILTKPNKKGSICWVGLVEGDLVLEVLETPQNISLSEIAQSDIENFGKENVKKEIDLTIDNHPAKKIFLLFSGEEVRIIDRILYFIDLGNKKILRIETPILGEDYKLMETISDEERTKIIEGIKFLEK